MTGLGPVTHDFADTRHRKTWVTGPSPVMTQGKIAALAAFPFTLKPL
jgi:hypothetical protein